MTCCDNKINLKPIDRWEGTLTWTCPCPNCGKEYVKDSLLNVVLYYEKEEEDEPMDASLW